VPGKPYSTAAVLGCNARGLAAARVLVKFFERVVCVECPVADPRRDPALRDDLRTHPQMRFVQARTQADVLLGPNGARAIGVVFDTAQAPEPSAVIADWVIDARGGSCREVERLVCAPDAPIDDLAAAFGARLREVDRRFCIPG
jgi:hypothetical protein